MAIMGFGGGAMIGSPLAVNLMKHFASSSSTGIIPTFVTMGLLYLTFMMFGVFTVRLPPEGWKPAGYQPPAQPKKTGHPRQCDSGMRRSKPRSSGSSGSYCS
jgi:hypothetical protein